MIILGISALYHDSAAAVIVDGKIVAAAQEERFSRVKHDKRFPANAVAFCLKAAECTIKDVNIVCYYDNPLLTLQRFVANVASLPAQEEDLITWTYDDIFAKRIWIKDQFVKTCGTPGDDCKFLVCEHHISHAASAFYPSPFDKALILTNDGVGEWDTTTISVGTGNSIKKLKTISYPHSLGLLYSAFTYYCGFKVNEGDYKFMGLAPYGEAKFYDMIKEKVIDIKEDGSYRLNMEYFDYQNGRTMISEKLEELFGQPRRQPESRITKHEMDVAASVQKVTEEIIVKQARYAKQLMPDISNIVLAGGCALNCVANGVLLREKIFENIWIQPAAGDAGGALGAALYTYYSYLNNARIPDAKDSQQGSYLGLSYSNDEVKAWLNENRIPYHEVSPQERAAAIAEHIADCKVIGLFQGRAEFGPRALGNRSIIADPRVVDMQSKMNLKIKFRESFRPFAPSVLAERASEYFELDVESPYMLLVADVCENRRIPFSLSEQLEYANNDMISIVNQPRSDIPAVTHVDYSARVQTVDPCRNPDYYAIIKEFDKKTGCPVVVNTSFNVRGEPIVNSPLDAYKCFMRTGIDVLVLENCILIKEEQPEFREETDWREIYELD